MKLLVTGGLGFIGVNAAAHFSKIGYDVFVIDNYHRQGVKANEQWLKAVVPKVKITRLDIRNGELLGTYVASHKFDVILHCAAQTAITTSVQDPAYDFATNAQGTFNVMESARTTGSAVIYASTNQVYGGMPSVSVWKEETRWRFSDRDLQKHGIDETCPTSPVSPYGCSKLSGEHYVLNYARVYGIKTVSFRQACIYGPRQLGGTDQGWLTWFMKAWIEGEPITIYGDGRQVRDVLYIDDLIQAYALAIKNIDGLSGQVFNIGGGPENAMSIWWELAPIMTNITGRNTPKMSLDDWRPGDQKVYVTDNRKLFHAIGWKPATNIRQGVENTVRWLFNTSIDKKNSKAA